MSWLVRDSIEQLRALSDGIPDDEYLPHLHAVRDEPPELDDDDFEVAFDDPADDYARAVFDPNRREWLDV